MKFHESNDGTELGKENLKSRENSVWLFFVLFVADWEVESLYVRELPPSEEYTKQKPYIYFILSIFKSKTHWFFVASTSLVLKMSKVDFYGCHFLWERLAVYTSSVKGQNISHCTSFDLNSKLMINFLRKLFS